MKITTLVSGSFAGNSFNIGDTLTGDSDFIRSLLVNGMANPADDEASAFVLKGDNSEYERVALQNAATEILEA